MKTFLIPTDFSDNAVNAIRYAVALAMQVKASKLVLYNTYATPAHHQLRISLFLL